MRRKQEIVVFALPFRLKSVDGENAPGRYEIVIEEEPMMTTLFEAWRRTSTQIRLPSLDRDTGQEQYTEIDPKELAAALGRDLDLSQTDRT